MDAVKAWIDGKFVDAAAVSSDFALCDRVPDCMQQELEGVSHYLLPASLGLTLGTLFAPKRVDAGHGQSRTGPMSDEQTGESGGRRSNGRRGVVVMMHGLTHEPVSSLWPWIHGFLKSGQHVFVLGLDGHTKPDALSTLDLRQASRTLPLFLQKLTSGGSGQSLSAEKIPFRLYLFGHALGGTYVLLAAARKEFQDLISGVMCVSPTLNAEGAADLSRTRSSLLHPVTYFRDSIQIMPYYGALSWRKLLGRGETLSLKGKFALAHAMESQLNVFLKECLASEQTLTGVHAPVFWLQADKPKEPLPIFVRHLMSQIKGPLVRYSDHVRNSLGIQFSLAWPQRAADFLLQLERESPRS